MTWPSSEPLSPSRLTALREEALAQGKAHAALLFQLHLLALEDTPQERDRLLFLLPERLRQLEDIPTCAEVLLRLFSGRSWDMSALSFGTSLLMEIAFLLREEAECFSPQDLSLIHISRPSSTCPGSSGSGWNIPTRPLWMPPSFRLSSRGWRSAPEGAAREPLIPWLDW